MITGLTLRHYRGFTDATLAIRPVTVLLGRNSVGKSSIIELLNILKQTAIDTSEMSRPALKLNGRFANAGAPEQIFHMGDTSQPVSIGIRFRPIKASLKTLVSNAELQFQQDFGTFASSLFQVAGASEDAAKAADRLIYSGAIERNKIRSLIEPLLNANHRLSSRGDNTRYRQIERLVGPRFLRRSSMKEGYRRFFQGQIHAMGAAQEFYERFQKIEYDEAEIIFRLRLQKSNLAIAGVSFKLGGQCVFDVMFESDSQNATASSNLVDLVRLQSKPDVEELGIPQAIRRNASVFKIFAGVDRRRFSSIENALLDTSSHMLEDLRLNVTGRALSHVPPVRAKPRRYYFSDEPGDAGGVASTVIDTLTRDQLICEQVNRWMARFGIKLSPLNEKEVYFRLLIEYSKLDIPLDITDVGFGVSQVLPILTLAFLAQQGSCVMIEQPEVHLHPKMQSALAELFDEATRCEDHRVAPQKIQPQQVIRDRVIIAETHSTYLLQKIGHLMSLWRRGEPQVYAISPDDVSVNFIEANDEGVAVINPIEAPRSGVFVVPDDFVDEELDMYFDMLDTPAK